MTFWRNLTGGGRPRSVAVAPRQVFKLVEAIVSPPKEIILLSEEAGEHSTRATVISGYFSLPTSV